MPHFSCVVPLQDQRSHFYSVRTDAVLGLFSLILQHDEDDEVGLMPTGELVHPDL